MGFDRRHRRRFGRRERLKRRCRDRRQCRGRRHLGLFARPWRPVDDADDLVVESRYRR
ncbi:MAG: hypothetical protein E6G81_02025 [Alphaproteobacteria bacterium]|nr:MAG: hypothetical protein E6G81_02025 [Alphaproteobacteria bacterium]